MEQKEIDNHTKALVAGSRPWGIKPRPMLPRGWEYSGQRKVGIMNEAHWVATRKEDGLSVSRPTMIALCQLCADESVGLPFRWKWSEGNHNQGCSAYFQQGVTCTVVSSAKKSMVIEKAWAIFRSGRRAGTPRASHGKM